MLDMERAIRELAYQQWEEAGCPHGSPDAFWLAAQRDIIAVSLSRMATLTVTAQAKPKKAKAASSSKKRRAA
jgi:hypothetical protein